MLSFQDWSRYDVTNLERRALPMIIMREEKETKTVVVYVYGVDFGMEIDNPYYQSELKRYSELGYIIHSVIFPLVTTLPKEVQEIYNSAYKCKSLLDALTDIAIFDFLPNILTQVVRNEISKFEIEDVAREVIDYEISRGIKNKE